MKSGLALTLVVLMVGALAACQNRQSTVRPQPPLIVDQETDDLPAEVRAGLLLPLTGPASDLGQDMLRAAQMALFDAGPNSVVLLPKDTRGSAEGAALAARELLNEGAEILIGPLFSRAVQAVTPIAQQAGVRVLAFSNVTSVADDGTYLLGFRPEEQVDRVVQYALDQGIEVFAGLAPDDAYGETAMRALQRAVIERGGTMGEVHYYPPTLDDPSSVVREIADFGERKAALEAERDILEAMGEGDEVARAVLKQIKSLDTFGEPPFDAIMIADGSDRLRSVASLLTFYDVDPTSRAVPGHDPLAGRPSGAIRRKRSPAAGSPRLRRMRSALLIVVSTRCSKRNRSSLRASPMMQQRSRLSCSAISAIVVSNR